MSSIWVDEVRTEMHQQPTWPGLNLDQLLDTKTKLLDKIYMAKGKPEYTRPLQTALANLEGLITAKLTSPSEKEHLKIT